MALMKRSLWAIAIMLILASCGDVAGDPAATVEQYLEAKVSGDRDTVTRLLCSAMESELEREVTSLANVEARIEDMSCTAQSDNIVSCSGQIVAVYGREDRAFPLGSYNVVQEDGEWRWCGEVEAP